MIADLVEGIRHIDRIPQLHTVDAVETREHNKNLRLYELARHICERSKLAMHINSTTNAKTFDPLQGYRDLKWHLIGDVRPVARLNLHYPPGVERQTHKGRRVYGVECAVKIDPDTGEALIWRKDDIVNSSDPTDWLVATYNPLNGEFHERDVVMVKTEPGDGGDMLTMQVAPFVDPGNANRGYTTITGQFSSGYHAIGDVVASRADYHGRGVGPEAHRISEGNYTVDIYALHQALEQVMADMDMPTELLDHSPDPHVVLGQYALTN